MAVVPGKTLLERKYEQQKQEAHLRGAGAASGLGVARAVRGPGGRDRRQADAAAKPGGSMPPVPAAVLPDMREASSASPAVESDPGASTSLPAIRFAPWRTIANCTSKAMRSSRICRQSAARPRRVARFRSSWGSKSTSERRNRPGARYSLFGRQGGSGVADVPFSTSRCPTAWYVREKRRRGGISSLGNSGPAREPRSAFPWSSGKTGSYCRSMRHGNGRGRGLRLRGQRGSFRPAAGPRRVPRPGLGGDSQRTAI